jgi:beta-ureidopropionase / N-carbamoyl-L-amino-acid hydrolase
VRRAGTDSEASPVMTGSHMDSQPRGGRFDGIYGVLAGLEALEALEAASVRSRRSIDLVAWTNEEGGRFAPGAMGSMVFTGARRLEEFLETVDAGGNRFKEALTDTLAATPEARRRAFGFPVAAYVEAHIEQGPLLENARRTIGVVTGIQGTRWFNVEVFGETAHAGTTPRAHRKDAVQDAVAIIGALRFAMEDETDTLRFTVGRILVTPNTPNSIPNYVSFSIDLRHPDQYVLTERGDAIGAICQGATKRCIVNVTETFQKMPCRFDEAIVDTIERAARALDLPHLRMPSGAFHDALFMNEICPTGMIFVPCEKGISHNEAENARPDDLAAGARVLTAALVELTSR